MWYGVLCGKCGSMWNIVELWWCDVECITHCHCISHLTTLPPHFTSHRQFYIKHHLWHSKPHHIPRHTIIPHHITHFVSHQHLSHTAIPLRNTIFKSHHIGHIMHHTTSRIAPHLTLVMYNIMPHSMYSMLHSDHTKYWPHHLCIAPPHNTTFYTLHRIPQAPHLASFHHICDRT